MKNNTIMGFNPDIIGLIIIGIIGIIGALRGDTSIVTGCTGIIGGYMTHDAIHKDTEKLDK